MKFFCRNLRVLKRHIEAGQLPRFLRHLIAFAKEHGLPENPLEGSAVMVTTKTFHAWKTVDGVTIEFVPTSLYAYVLGQERYPVLNPHCYPVHFGLMRAR